MSWLKRLLGIKEIEADPMKYLIVGLGNMGPKYDDTRHNVGFEVIDALAKAHDVIMKSDNLGDVGQFRHKSRVFVLLKPSTFMNLSGKAVRYWLQKHKIEKSNLLVVVDDLNLSFGTLRLKGKGSDGGHNGLKDIDKMCGGNNYARLRLGIGDEFGKGRQVDFVLGEWSNAEREKLPEILESAAETVKSFATIGLQHTMSKFNKKI